MAKYEVKHFPLKGWSYYHGPTLWKLGHVNPSSQLQLKAEPDNPFDRYAVQVYLNHSEENKTEKINTLIGYLPRVSAPIIQFLLLHNQIQNICISQIKGTPPYHLELKIHYKQPWWLRLYFPIWKYFHPQHKNRPINRYYDYD